MFLRIYVFVASEVNLKVRAARVDFKKVWELQNQQYIYI